MVYLDKFIIPNADIEEKIILRRMDENGGVFGYKYTLVCENRSKDEMAAEGIASSDSTDTTVRFCIPGECYGADSTACLYLLELKNYYGDAVIKGCGCISIEGYDLDGNGSASLTVKKVIEHGQVY